MTEPPLAAMLPEDDPRETLAAPLGLPVATARRPRGGSRVGPDLYALYFLPDSATLAREDADPRC